MGVPNNWGRTSSVYQLEQTERAVRYATIEAQHLAQDQ
jgi:hypothetical protein